VAVRRKRLYSGCRNCGAYSTTYWVGQALVICLLLSGRLAAYPNQVQHRPPYRLEERRSSGLAFFRPSHGQNAFWAAELRLGQTAETVLEVGNHLFSEQRIRAFGSCLGCS
jgi:hypothetical protein